MKISDALSRVLTIRDNLAYQTSLSATQRMGTIKAALQEYPPKVATSKYVRTYELRNGWASAKPTVVSSNQKQVVVRLTNDRVRYWRYVQDERLQGRVNVGRWKTIQQITRLQLPALKRQIDADLQTYVDLTLSR